MENLIITQHGMPIGRLISPSKKMRDAIRLIMVKSTPFGADPLREFIIHNIKAPIVLLLGCRKLGFRELIIFLRLVKNFRKLPSPTKENTWHPNSHKIIDLRDEFFKHENNWGRDKAFRMIWDFIIITYDADLYYRERIDWVMKRLLPWEPYEGEEKPRSEWWVD